ncbi:MAG: hypothetical protein KJ620_03145 [Candidatus Edwardsbacteria bacterium]|nr:hypothetical protein [Candidatus Edwardsbacteria bacterium]MBU1575684.1 hypothetical protein [Candidatus Edwardsbacteria bacterium]MBU2594649.1 hypothetical protein [Candidatus Edwardsbacteria bacterium]
MKTYIQSILIFLLVAGMGCSKEEPVEPKPDPLPVNPPHGVYHYWPSWSPDGSRILFDNHDGDTYPDSMGLWTVKPDGSEMQPFFITADNPEYTLFCGTDWSPDGQWIVASLNLDIYKIKANGDSLIRLTNMGLCSYPAWSKDGNNIAFYKGIDSSGIWVMDKDGNSQRRIAPYYESPAWIDNQTVLGLVYSNDPSYTYYFYYLKKIDIFTCDTTLIDTIYGRTQNPMYSSDGNTIAVQCQKYLRLSQIYTISASGGNHKNLMGDPSICDNIGEYPRWSPDGTKIVYSNCCRTNGKLWIMNADGTGKYQLTF